MEVKTRWKEILLAGISGIVGFLSSGFCVAGCYPLVPAFFSAVLLLKRRNLMLYFGTYLGIAYYMGLNDVVKYIFILTVSAVGIRFFLWANHKCSGWTSGIIAGTVTAVMNWSGSLLSLPDKKSVLIMLSEGLTVTAGSVFLHYLIQILMEAVHSGLPEPDTIRKRQASVPSGRIEAFANAFDGLSLAFSSMSQPKQRDSLEEVGLLQQEITGKLCTDCSACSVCWNENNSSPALNIHKMLKEVIAHRPKDEILKEEFLKNCQNYNGMVEEAIAAFSRMELNQAWYQRLLENRMMIAQQLDAMADMMDGWIKGSKCIDAKNRISMARIALEAKEKGILARDIHLFLDDKGHKMIRAEVSGKWGGAIPVKNYVSAVEKAMGIPLRCGKNSRGMITKEETEIMLYQDTSYYVLQGIADRKKDGSFVSGDNYSGITLDSGHYMICLSDGMGSGTGANQESEMVVDLMDKFLEAGFKKEAAVKLMNSAMVLQGENNMFSTLDLADIDLYTGEAEFYKIGAAASFIKHRDHTECFRSPALPAGVQCAPEMDKIEKRMENGEFLVMVTDGVLEYLRVKNPETKLKEIIENIKTGNAGVLAKTVLERVLLLTGGVAADDMTILVTGIWEK